MEPREAFLAIRNLHIRFAQGGDATPAVRGLSLTMPRREVLAVVGESGSGKSVTALALTGLLPDPPEATVSGEVWFEGREVRSLPRRARRKLRGSEIAYIFQEPASALNPVFPVGAQIREALVRHQPAARNVKERAIAAMDEVGIRDAAHRYGDYPHQMSGGMLQRVMIAMALVGAPKLLIADEPTTALDVTIQKQIMDLLARLHTEREMAILLITHNFGIVKGFADRVAVMLRGELVEEGATERILTAPAHPYTRGLLACIPRPGQRRKRLPVIDHTQRQSHPV